MPPPKKKYVIEGRANLYKLYITWKEIYQRVWFIFNIEEIFWFHDFMSDFCEIVGYVYHGSSIKDRKSSTHFFNDMQGWIIRLSV